MTTTAQLLLDGFDRVRNVVHGAVSGLSGEQLDARVGPEANSIAWLAWHLARVQDDHVAGVAGTEQVWTGEGWRDRFDLPFPPGEIGYGQASEQVAQVRGLTPELLLGYLDAVTTATARYVGGLSDDDLDHVVDENWDPPVTLAVRLVSVLSDDLQHAGQAAYVRGLVSRGG